jgi:hypothetical protein
VTQTVSLRSWLLWSQLTRAASSPAANSSRSSFGKQAEADTYTAFQARERKHLKARLSERAKFLDDQEQKALAGGQVDELKDDLDLYMDLYHYSDLIKVYDSQMDRSEDLLMNPPAPVPKAKTKNVTPFKDRMLVKAEEQKSLQGKAAEPPKVEVAKPRTRGSENSLAKYLGVPLSLLKESTAHSSHARELGRQPDKVAVVGDASQGGMAQRSRGESGGHGQRANIPQSQISKQPSANAGRGNVRSEGVRPVSNAAAPQGTTAGPGRGVNSEWPNPKNFSRWCNYAGIGPRVQDMVAGVQVTVEKLSPETYGGNKDCDLGLCKSTFTPNSRCPYFWTDCPLRHWQLEPIELQWAKDGWVKYVKQRCQSIVPYPPDFQFAKYQGRPRWRLDYTVWEPPKLVEAPTPQHKAWGDFSKAEQAKYPPPLPRDVEVAGAFNPEAPAFQPPPVSRNREREASEVGKPSASRSESNRTFEWDEEVPDEAAVQQTARELEAEDARVQAARQGMQDLQLPQERDKRERAQGPYGKRSGNKGRGGNFPKGNWRGGQGAQ